MLKHKIKIKRNAKADTQNAAMIMDLLIDIYRYINKMSQRGDLRLAHTINII